MVAVAAFLVILVILFGIENVRSFFFGTLGVFAWIIIGILALAAIIVAVDWIEKEIKKDIADAKKEKEQRKKQKQAKKLALEKFKQEHPAEYKKQAIKTNLAIIGLSAFFLILIGLIVALYVTGNK